MHHVNFLQPHQRGWKHFSLPEYSENSGKCISITLSTHVETVVLLSKGEVDSKKIRVEFSLEDMDMSEFQDGATYPQIKEYVLEHTRLKVSNLYISQIKRKCGIEVEKLQSAEVRGFQTATMPAGKRESNPRSIQIFWNDLTSSKMEVFYGSQKKKQSREKIYRII